jgi:hypothetical protein
MALREYWARLVQRTHVVNRQSRSCAFATVESIECVLERQTKPSRRAGLMMLLACPGHEPETTRLQLEINLTPPAVVSSARPHPHPPSSPPPIDSTLPGFRGRDERGSCLCVCRCRRVTVEEGSAHIKGGGSLLGHRLHSVSVGSIDRFVGSMSVSTVRSTEKRVKFGFLDIS